MIIAFLDGYDRDPIEVAFLYLVTYQRIQLTASRLIFFYYHTSSLLDIHI